MRCLRLCLLLCAIAACLTCACAAERPALQDLGRAVKMRILVDKVMQPTRAWKTEEWMVKEAAEAGFNVFSPRLGYDNMEAVRQVTAWCRKYGIYHQPWMRGVQGVPADPALSAGKRMVWANGAEQAIWSPNSDELWAWMASHIVPYAELSAQDDTLMAVFLDYENYWPGGMGNLYELSYDDVIMGKFAAAQQLELPQLELKDRQPWLEQQGLHDEFRAFQIAHWRQKCRELRQAVDPHNPKFMFNIYPAPGTMFMLEACYPEWATKDAPLILADPWTYGRPGRYTGHDLALKENQKILQRGLEQARATGINQIYIGGIDPVVTGADPEFCGKNALMLSGISDGYWIFYEGPKYETTHPDYFKWFAWANRKMETGDFAAAWQPRETEDPWGFPKITVSGPLLSRTTKREYPLVKMRGTDALLVSAHKECPIVINMQTFRIGRNETPLVWTVKTPGWEDLAKGEIGVATTGAINFQTPADGLYILLLEAAGNAFAVLDSTAPLALFAEPNARLIYGAEKLYFAVPAGVKTFRLTTRGGGGVETVRVRVHNPQGAEAAVGQATLQQNQVQIPVTVGADDGKVWSLTIEKAEAGVLEDNSLSLDAQLPQTLSYFADEVFEIQRRPQ
jgi:hypothetical protein